MDFFKSAFVFLQTAKWPRILVGFGGLLLGGVGIIVYKDIEYNRINSSVIIVFALFGLTLTIMGILIKSRFTAWGMVDLRNFRDAADMGSFLGKCDKKIIIVKTWFPEDEEIAGGLEDAVRLGATIKMILCDPKAPTLAQRTDSTDTKQLSARRWIWSGMDLVAKITAEEKFKGVGLYDAWPGCPMIWANDRIFMGFYFWGHTSPNQPWVEVRAGSKLSKILVAQKRKLWRVSKKLETLEELRKWLDENPPPPAEEGGT